MEVCILLGFVGGDQDALRRGLFQLHTLMIPFLALKICFSFWTVSRAMENFGFCETDL
jgi:hypothetical protein